MSVDFTKPTATADRAQNLTDTKDTLVAVAKQIDDTTPTGAASGMIRWSTTNSKWQKYNGSTWGDLAATYSITVTGLSGVTATAAELNILDGATVTTAELNILDGVTATASDLNKTTAIASGSWVPTVTLGANAVSASISNAIYMRVGSVVTCSFYVSVDPSAAEVSTVFYVSLPVASAFDSSADANGSFVPGGTNERIGVVIADFASDRLTFAVTPTGTGSSNYRAMFQYAIK